MVLLYIGQAVSAQNRENTKASPDQVLKSNARVNPSTLAMELSIPIASLPGRGGTSMPLVFNYSSKVWRIQGGASYDTGNVRWTYGYPTYSDGTVSGWTSTYGVPMMTYTFDDSEVYDCQANPTGNSIEYGSPECGLFYVKRVRVTLPDGSSHEFLKDNGVYSFDPTAPSIDRSGTFLSVDGSRMRLEMVSTGGGGSTLYLPDGSRYLFANNTTAEKFIDKNGNVLTFNPTFNGWTDTLGKTLSNPFPSPVPVNYSHPEQTQNINVPNIGSGTRQYQLVWKKLSNGALAAGEPTNYYDADSCTSGVRTSRLFSPSGTITVCSDPADFFDPVVLTEVILPNGSKYKFQYNKFGEIVRIDYPTGGYEKFVYAEIAPLSSTRKPAYDQANRGVASRIVGVGDGTTEYTWTYQAGYTGTVFDGSPYYVTTTAPDGTKTKQILHRNQANRKNYGFDNPLTGREMETQVIDTLGNIRSRTLTEWETTNGGSPGAAADPKRDIRVKLVFNIINDPATGSLISMTENKYDTDASSDPAQFSSLNLKWSKTYDYKVLTTTINTGDTAAAFAIFAGAAPAAISETTYLYDVNYRNRGIVGLATQTVIKDGTEAVKAKSEITYDEPNYFETANLTAPGFETPNTNYRALPTTVKSWYDATNAQSFIATHTSYDQFGNPRKMWDGKGNVSEIEYADNYTDGINRNTYALPTKTTSAVPGGNGSATAFVTTITYDFNTGLPIFTKDANNQISEIQYNDALLRPTKAIAPNGQQTITEYGVPVSGQLPASQRFVKVKTQIDANNWKEGYTWFDGLSRTVKTQSIDTNGDVFALVCYDAYGRQSKTSNPFRNNSASNCSSNLEWTTTTYDAAGKPWKMTTPDNAVAETNYSLATAGSNIGTVVTVTDPALKQRRSITNALGQLTRVDEPNEAGNLGTIYNPNQPTNYTYDVLNNLVTVSQAGTIIGQCGGLTSNCSQTRNFVYDSLSRLKSANNPESGLISYQYDHNSNLTSKTDGRSITTQYFYDALNRITQRTYSGETDYATPTVFYFYDNLPNAKGRLIKVSSSVSATEYSNFDILGRALMHKQMTDGRIYSTGYSYNLSGALIEQTYPSGRVVKNVLDTDGDLAEVESKRSAADVFRNYATNFVYTAAGAISSVKLGNGRFENTLYNSRLQPVQIGLGSSVTNQNLLKLNFDYGAADNNGNVKAQTITVLTTGNVPGFIANQTYSYDSLNRIKQAQEIINNNQPPNWKQTFVYDRFGNRRFEEANTTTLAQNCPTAVCNPTVDPVTNKLVGYQFDGAGNTKTDAENKTFTYDGENKQVEVKDTYGNSIGKYFYDGDGKRVKKISLTETTMFIYDAKGQLVAEYSTQLSQQPNISYMTADYLGSPRITTNAVGQVISRHDYQPFGEEIARTDYDADAVRKKFTGYERDTETELDYAQARMYTSQIGRFSSPDPLLITGQTDSPQTWNRFSYVVNNPFTFVDPTGMYLCTAGKTNCEKFEASLQESRTNLEKIKEKYGENSDKYKDAKAAIDVYGNKDEDNGVTIMLPGKNSTLPKDAAATAQTEGVSKKKTALNPTGQSIRVTITQQTFDSKYLTSSIVHEGSHAADGAAWVACNFCSSKNPTMLQTESKAYMIQAAFSEAMGVKDWANYDPVQIKGKPWAFGLFQVWTPGWESVDMSKPQIEFFLTRSTLYRSKLNKKLLLKGATF